MKDDSTSFIKNEQLFHGSTVIYISAVGPFEVDGITYDRYEDRRRGGRIPGSMMLFKSDCVDPEEPEECYCPNYVVFSEANYYPGELEDLEYI